MNAYPNPTIIAETEWLADRLDDHRIRIIDCHVDLAQNPEGGYLITKGRAAWCSEHIPGADFIDLVDELSAPDAPFPFMMPDPGQFAEVMRAHGICNDDEVVVYSAGVNYWATRLFFMFQAMGHRRVRVLNGGWDKWQLEQRPVTPEPPRRRTSEYRADPRPGFFLGKEDVYACLGDQRSCLLNALSAEVFSGEAAPYGRPGHIPGSRSLPAASLVNPHTMAFLPADVLRKRLEEAGAFDADKVISYCGGGISATTSAFALWLLGFENVAIYDGSMSEWAADPAMPLEMGH